MQVTCSGWRKHTSNMCPASGPKTLKCCYGPPGASAAYVRQISFPNARVWVWFFKNSRCWKLASEVTLTTILLSSCSYSPAGHHVKKNQCKHHVQIKVAWSQKVYSLLLKPKKKWRCQITLLNAIRLKKRCSGVWFGTFFKDLSQSENIPQIKPPLTIILALQSYFIIN